MGKEVTQLVKETKESAARRRILFADDNQNIRKAVSTWFAGMPDFEPLVLAENGGEAVEKAMLQSPDLAILDLSMPVMDGLEAARRLNALKPEIPVIIFSLHAETMRMKEEVLKSWGISAVVSKNEATTELVGKVRELLQLDN